MQLDARRMDTHSSSQNSKSVSSTIITLSFASYTSVSLSDSLSAISSFHLLVITLLSLCHISRIRAPFRDPVEGGNLCRHLSTFCLLPGEGSKRPERRSLDILPLLGVELSIVQVRLLHLLGELSDCRDA